MKLVEFFASQDETEEIGIILQERNEIICTKLVIYWERGKALIVRQAR